MLALLALLGCNGDGDVQRPTSPTADTDTDTDTTTGVDPGTTLPEPGQGHTPLRRLTSSQYDNTVRDLFPTADIPPQGIVADRELHGFDNNGASQVPSALLVEQYQAAAIAVTEAAFVDTSWKPCDATMDGIACAHATILDVAPRAFRRPLTPDEQATFTGFFDELVAEEEGEVALQLTLQALLNSPEFLTFPEHGVPGGADENGRIPLTSFEVATRLSYFLWNTMPDRALFEVAARDGLRSADAVETEAWRMLEDPRARDAVANFHRQWLDLDDLDQVAPDPEAHPGWSETLRDEMRQELDDLVQHAVFGPEPTLATLLTTRHSVAGDALNAHYGGTLPADQRAGLLTRGAWLALTSHPVHPSPVQRGVFVLDRLLCKPPGAPPADVSTDPPTDGAGAPETNRERYAAHTQDPNCARCHDAIDPIGFAFEHYDATGAWRDRDGFEEVELLRDRPEIT